jgi:hypothetical protein
MKKPMIFLFALMMISSLSFGAGLKFTWVGYGNNCNPAAGSPTDWQNPCNWVVSLIVPNPNPILAGTSTWPGQNPLEDDDYVLFDDGNIWSITNVPTCKIGRLEINNHITWPFNTDITLQAAIDGNTLTIKGGMVFTNLWHVKIEDGCALLCNDPYKRVKIVCEPGVNFWQKDFANFDAADYSAGGTVCDQANKGFVLEANAADHAEFIQQFNTTQPVKGWIEYVFDDNKYHFICPPVTSESTPEFLPPNSSCRIPNSLFTFTGDYLRKFNNGGTWDNWLGSLNGYWDPLADITTGRGYEYYGAPGNNSGGIYSFYGTLNSQDPLNCPPLNPLGNYELVLPVNTPGWNFIGNPFASAIQFVQAACCYPGPGWVWDLGKTDPWAYYWDNSLANYHVYNWFTGVGNGPLIDRTLIPRSQGFFVHVFSYQPGAPHIPSGSDIAVGNQARVFRPNNSIGKSVTTNVMNVSLKGESGKAVDEAIINFRDDANGAEFNRLLDAYKFFNEITNPSQLYFKTSDNVYAAVKTLKLATGNVMYPLYIRVTSTGTYTLDVKEISTFSANTGILLKDNKTNTTIDLKANPVYTFTATAGDDDARFSLYFTDVLYGINNLTDNTFTIYSYDKSIYVQNNDPKLSAGTVLVYDIIGKQMLQENLNSGITRINANLNKGFYIVSVKTDKGVYNQKVYIN